jgi:hypothetical protein
MVLWIRDEFRGQKGVASFYGGRVSVVVVQRPWEQDTKNDYCHEHLIWHCVRPWLK